MLLAVPQAAAVRDGCPCWKVASSIKEQIPVGYQEILASPSPEYPLSSYSDSEVVMEFWKLTGEELSETVGSHGCNTDDPFLPDVYSLRYSASK